MGGQAPHPRKASNVYGGAGPPQKSPRLWKFAPARGGNANNTGVLPFEAVSPCHSPVAATGRNASDLPYTPPIPMALRWTPSMYDRNRL